MPLEGKYAAAWRYFNDAKNGFRAQYGLTFPVQSAPGFRISYEGHGCQWNGPSWPFATSVALTALADSIHTGARLPVGRADPIVPPDWTHFRLVNVPVRGRLVSVTYDRDGSHYGKGKGIRITSE